MTPQTPQLNQAQILGDPEEADRLMLDSRLSQVWTALPGIIVSADYTAMTCAVQPAIQGVVTNTDGILVKVNLPQLINVPICYPSGGGFTITFPLVVGDEVLVIWASRCIDAWWQYGGIQPPMEYRMHDLNDGFAVPGPKSQPKVISGISSTSLQIRNNTGDTYLEIAADGKINLVSTAGVVVTGDLEVSGSISAASVEAGVVDLSTHIHSGVQTGGGDTGPPV